jgi:NADPH2:quinone reductase
MSNIHAIRIHKPGGPEALVWEAVSLPDPGPKEIQVKHTAIGLNYIDVYHRMGLYPLDLPSGVGMEGAGTVEAVGSEVTSYLIGDRVAYGTGPIGAYAERSNLPEDRVVPVPEEISDQRAAAMMLQGLTAHYLLNSTYKVRPGDIILIHAAAGGVGLIVCQWAKSLGATVIGTVGSPKKADLVSQYGCDHPILYGEENFVERVKDLTSGSGVHVVYDSVGRDTVYKSLQCLRPRGMLVSFGNASGPPNPINIGELGTMGSLFVTRPSLFHYFAQHNDLQCGAQDLFKAVESGIVRIEINQEYALKDAARAHRDLEARRTTGSSILIP